MTEIWKDVVGYEEYFQVSNTGKIFSKRSNKELKQTIHKTGYYTFATRFSGRGSPAKCFKPHILVAKAFIDNPENKPTVNHIDGNKLNNYVDNLEWATYSEQARHAIDTGLNVPTRGTERSTAKLTEDDVRYIRNVYKRGHPLYGCRALAEQFGVHHTKISRAIRGVSYQNVV